MDKISKLVWGMLAILTMVFSAWFFTINVEPTSAYSISNNQFVQTSYVSNNEPILPIPLEIKLNEDKVALGEALFHDVRLSVDNTLSCANCHNLSTAGTIRTPKAPARNGEMTHRNSPTVFNSSFNFVQFWDGRAETLEKQINETFANKNEFNITWPEIVAKLNAINKYKELFEKIYPQGITPDTIKNAIATFERSLITPNSRFDRYLRNEPNVLTDNEIRGYQTFKNLGCISCHQGVNIGGNLYQPFGIFKTIESDSHTNETIDLGRYEVTGKESDKFVFKVPSLRNVAVTSPYFHDGSVETLEEAISKMGKYQLGRILSDNEIKDIAAFLKTLTGEYKGLPL